MRRFENASDLVRAVNEYLDSLEGKPPKDEKEARERIRTLLFFREEMVAFHFRNPRFAVMDLMRILHDAARTMDRDDFRQIIPELRLIRYTYELRRITYERARAAYIANRAALRILEQKKFEYLLPHLPYGGEYLAALEQYGGTVLAVFRDVLEDLGVRERRVEVDEEGYIEEKAATKGIFGDKVATEVLVSTLMRKALDRVWRAVLRREREEIKNYERILEYEAIVRRYDLTKIRENPGRLWELLQALEEKGFLRDGDVDPEIIEGLRKRRAIRFRSVRDALWEELQSFLFDYYLLTPERVRRNAPLFPGLPVTPEPLSGVLGDNIEILREKVYLESVLKIPSALVGLAVLHIRKGIPVDELSARYGYKKEEISSAVEIVRAALSGDERVRRFVEFLRGGGDGS